MRIIQGKDYYDNALAFGRDETIVFVRHKDMRLADDDVPGYDKAPVKWHYDFELIDTKTDKIITTIYRSFTRYSFRDRTIDINPIIVVFCGKIYHGLMTETAIEHTVNPVLKGGHWHYEGTETTYHWTEEGFLKWLDRQGVKFNRLMTGGWGARRAAPLSVMFSINDPPKAMADWLLDKKVVVAIRAKTDRYYEHKHIKPWAINSDGLKSVQFAKAVDPYAAFQEISMWLGNLGMPGNEMVEIADKDRIAKHGFDKHSFRKMPQE